MFVVDKKVIHSVYSNLLKLVSKFNEIYVQVDKSGIWLIVNVDTYIKVYVPAEVEEGGLFKVQKEIFESIFKLRADKLQCSFNREQNILNVSAGTKTELYVSFKVIPEEIEEPIIESNDVINLKPRAIGDFRATIQKIKFISPDPTNTEYVYIRNGKKLEMLFASTNIFARYVFREPLSDEEDFELCIPLDKFRLALSLIDSSLQISLNDHIIKVTSDRLIVTMPTLLDPQFMGMIEACEELQVGTAVMEGKMDISIKDMQAVLDSVRSIASGNGIINFTVEGTKMSMELENNNGTTKDAFEIESNDIDDKFSFGIPELFIDATLEMAGVISPYTVMRFGEDFKYFILKQRNDAIQLTMLGPIAE